MERNARTAGTWPRIEASKNVIENSGMRDAAWHLLRQCSRNMRRILSSLRVTLVIAGALAMNGCNRHAPATAAKAV